MISGLLAWASRRSGGLAMMATILLSYYVITREGDFSGNGLSVEGPHRPTTESISAARGAGWLTPTFAYYCLIIHLLVFAFPMRSCYAIWDMTRGVQRTVRSRALRDLKLAHRRRGSSTSLSSAETLTSSHASSASSEAGDIEADIFADADAEPDRVLHAIVIPNYKEEMDTLRETLDVLGSHPQARNSYDIYLAMESRETNGEMKALALVQEFVKKFRNIDFCVHPSDIAGESPGKGSNMAWAARKLSERYPLEQRKDVIVTGIDADSHLSSNYFALTTSMHIAHPETATTTLYSAPIIFDRNAHNVPALVRVADILWCAAGMSGLYTGSTIAPPTSVYSVPLQLVDRVGGWDCDSEAIGEDLHMYLKCFFVLNGNLTVRTVISPVSQSNVTGGAGSGFSGTWADVQARYKQAMRHMWGALDTGFALRELVKLWRERKHTARAFRPLHSALNNPTDAYIPIDQLTPSNSESATVQSGIFADVTRDTLQTPDYARIFYLFHRLFEAHFLPVQTTILILTSTLYVWATDGNDDIHGVNWIFAVCNILRTVGFMEVAFYLFLYERFHRLCVSSREKEMTDAGLAKGMNFSHRSLKKNYMDYFMVPLVAPIYGAIPCAQAQICHFWTLDLVYTVSKKVTRQRSKSMEAGALV